MSYITRLFKKSSGPVDDEENTPFIYNKESVEKEITKRVKLGIVFGITSLLIFLGLIIIFYKVYVFKEEEEGCRIFPFHSKPTPMVVLSGSNDFIYPKYGEKFLAFASGQPLDIICPGRTVNTGQSSTESSLLSAHCTSGSTLQIADEQVDWRDLKCNGKPSSTIRYTGNSCKNNGKEIEIGFEISTNRFLRSMLICFNHELQRAYYAYVKIPASIKQRVLLTPRPGFTKGTGFYFIQSVDGLYKIPNEQHTLNELLGLPNNSNEYIQDNITYFLSRGHLTANMDNFYADQQRATFYYPNVAPQWQTLNGYNWNQIEIDVRDYADHNAVDLEVWTGVHGVAMLPSATTGNPVGLYLYVEGNVEALPVPEIYWKVVYNRVTKRGTAVICINNPYKTTFTKICEDVSDNLTWLRYKRNNQKEGFCYACSIDTFREVITSLPNIIVKGLLL